MCGQIMFFDFGCIVGKALGDDAEEKRGWVCATSLLALMFSNTQDSNEVKTQFGHTGTAELLELKKREDDLFPVLCSCPRPRR